MDIGSVGSGAEAVAAQQEANAIRYQTSVLKKNLDSNEQTAARLIQMIGDVGRNLDVVG